MCKFDKNTNYTTTQIAEEIILDNDLRQEFMKCLTEILCNEEA